MPAEKSVTVWDGKFIRFEKEAEANTDAAAGKLQIWKGALNAKLGWDPGYYMKYPNEFVQTIPAPFPHPTDPGTPGIGISNGGIKDSMTVGQPVDGNDLSIYDNDDQAPSLAAGDKLFYDGRLLVTNFVPDGYNTGQNEIHLLLAQLTVPERAVGVHHYQVQTAAGLWTNPITVTYTAPPSADEPDPIEDPIDVVIPPVDPCPPKKSK